MDPAQQEGGTPRHRDDEDEGGHGCDEPRLQTHGEERRAHETCERRDPQQDAVVGRCRGLDGVAPGQCATVHEPDDEQGARDRGETGQEGQSHEVAVVCAQRREVLHGEQVGEVGDGEEERSGVGQEERRQREGGCSHPDLPSHRERDRREQHCGRVEPEEGRDEDRQRGEQQPQHDGVVTGQAGRGVTRDVEDAREVGDLGDDGDGHEEGHDRKGPGEDLGGLGGAHLTVVSSTQGWPGRAGSVRPTSKAGSSARASAAGVRGSRSTPSRCRVTRPRVCLAMWVAPGTRTCTQRRAVSPLGVQAAV